MLGKHENVFEVQRRAREKRRVGLEVQSVADDALLALGQEDAKARRTRDRVGGQTRTRLGVGPVQMLVVGQGLDQADENRYVRLSQRPNPDRDFLRPRSVGRLATGRFWNLDVVPR